MVKPPKTMQPEAVQLDKAGRGITKAFTENSFHNYMARKIDMQRKQFGLVLPPPPIVRKSAGETCSNISKPIHDKEPQQSQQPTPSDGTSKTNSHLTKRQGSSSRSKGFGIVSVLKRLQKRHGVVARKRKRPGSYMSGWEEIMTPSSKSGSIDDPVNIDIAANQNHDCGNNSKVTAEVCTELSTSTDAWTRRRRELMSSQQDQERSDLFLRGIVVMVNGYTHPDSETLQRLLHRYGGDLEKYETSRVTHILAEQLSTAKANMYKRQRNPKPVCRPVWIVDCVQAQRLLPHIDYLLDQIRQDDVVGTKSLKSFFASKSSGPVVCSLQENDTEKDTMEKMKASHDESVKTPQRECGENGYNLVNENESEMHITNESPQGKIDTVDETICLGHNHFEERTENVGPVHATALKKNSSTIMKTDKYINGRIRTVGTDPNFLESFFAASRLSFIGSYKQRTRRSPHKKSASVNVDTERLVFHVDMDSFFASVVLRNYPEYRDKPVVISHHGGDSNASRDAVPNNSSSECATCNYEARKYGIQKGMYLGRAKALCPDLIILQYDFEGYKEVSESVAEILYRYTAEYDGFVEQVSCDESYVEFHFPKRGDEESISTLSMASQVAERIRQEIFDATQCTATVGVASNKLLAKLATDHVKPNRSFVVDDYKELLRPLNLRDLYGIGYRLERKLEDEGLVTVQDVWDMGSSGENELCRILGPGLGKKIFGFCKGTDDRPVQPAERKTIGAEVKFVHGF